jgi:hypothetical protein
LVIRLQICWVSCAFGLPSGKQSQNLGVNARKLLSEIVYTWA